MQIYHHKNFIKIILLTGFFAINNIAVVAMQEPEASTENTVADDIVNNIKQENNVTTEDSKITENNKLPSVELLDTTQDKEIITTEAVTEVDSTDSKVDSTPANDEIVSASINTDSCTNNEESSDEKQQDNKILIENPYIYITPGDNAAAYVTIQNKTNKHIILAEVKIENNEAVKKIEIHDNHKINKVMKMVHQKNGLKIKANSELQLKEGGKHIMLFEINKELFTEGKNIDLILKFINKDNSILEVIQRFDIKEFKCKKCCNK